ncbi:MAG: ATP-binding protein [Promethearchaeota archaeon]
MSILKRRRNQAFFDLITIRIRVLGKLFSSIFGFLEYYILEFLRLTGKIFHINSLNFVIKYIFKAKWGGRVIPISQSIDSHVKFLPSQEILELISRSNIVGLATCYCRDTQRKHEITANCTHPLNTCIHLSYGNSLHEIPFKSENLREISKKRVKQLLIKFEDRGLIHQIIFFPNPFYYYVICNCCPCCCIVLSKFLKMGSPQIIKSDFIAETNLNKCKNCGICSRWCYFGARVINKKLEFKSNLCFGCGICVNKCPEEAIVLKKRDN